MYSRKIFSSRVTLQLLYVTLNLWLQCQIGQEHRSGSICVSAHPRNDDIQGKRFAVAVIVFEPKINLSLSDGSFFVRQAPFLFSARNYSIWKNMWDFSFLNIERQRLTPIKSLTGLGLTGHLKFLHQTHKTTWELYKWLFVKRNNCTLFLLYFLFSILLFNGIFC